MLFDVLLNRRIAVAVEAETEEEANTLALKEDAEGANQQKWGEAESMATGTTRRFS